MASRFFQVTTASERTGKVRFQTAIEHLGTAWICEEDWVIVEASNDGGVISVLSEPGIERRWQLRSWSTAGAPSNASKLLFRRIPPP